MSEPSLPPHQSLRVYTQNQRVIILSIAEAGLTIGKGTPYPTFDTTDFVQGVYLFSQKLIVKSDIRVPFGLTISTCNLSAPTGTVCLDATGVQGKDDGTPGTRNGKPGGAFGLYIHDLDDAASLSFSRRSQGGQGGNTYRSDGVAGNGGQGGSIISVLQPTYVPLLEFAEKYRARAEFHPADRVRALTADDPLYHGAIAVLEKARSISAPQTTITDIFSVLSTSLAKIRDRTETRTALQIKLDLVNGITKLEGLIEKQLQQQAPKLDNYRGGYGGRGINVDVRAGNPGAEGNEEQIFITKSRSSVQLAKQRLPFAHPELCAMLLERADVFFYINSPLMRKHAQRLYQQIIDRLSFLPLKPTDPLYRAYEQSPIMPPSSLTDLARIRTLASTQLVVLTSGEVDYNGFAPQWVPRASYNSYKRALDDALANLRLFEEAYTKYHVALTKQEDLNDKAKLAYQNTSRMVSTLKEDQTDLRLTLQDLDRKIAAMAPVVNEAQRNLKRAYDAVLEQIRNSFGLHISQIVNAFSLITFSPMGIASFFDVIREGFTTVPTIDGFNANREYLASEIRKSEASIRNIAKVLKDKLDGDYKLNDPFSTRLVIAKEQILAELERFSSEAFGGISSAEIRKDLETKFDAFIEAVTKRNALILRYNMNIKFLQQSIKEARGYEAERQKLAARPIKHNDPDLPAITAYMASIYQSSRARVMKMLNLLLRSLNFRMLQSYDVIDFIFPGGSHSETTIDNVPLTLTAAVPASARDKIEELFWKSVERWGSEPARFPGNFDVDPGKRYFLNASQRTQLLTSNEHKVVVPIPVGTRGDFDRCCNIRIYRVRFGFGGLKTKATVPADGSVFVQTTLVHGGHDTIVDRQRKAVSFDHDRVSTVYSFRLKPDCSSTVIDNGNVAQADVNSLATSYAAPGPFTEWTVSLKWTLHANGTETDWEGLDLSEVNEAYLDFCGTNYGFLDP